MGYSTRHPELRLAYLHNWKIRRLASSTHPHMALSDIRFPIVYNPWIVIPTSGWPAITVKKITTMSYEYQLTGEQQRRYYSTHRLSWTYARVTQHVRTSVNTNVERATWATQYVTWTRWYFQLTSIRHTDDKHWLVIINQSKRRRQCYFIHDVMDDIKYGVHNNAVTQSRIIERAILDD